MTCTVVYLCSFVLPRLPSQFIQEQYGELYGRLPSIIQGGINDGPLLRAGVTCLKSVLMAFEGSTAVWQERTSLNELLSLVLGLCLDERPKVRKLAQDCLVAVLLAEDKKLHAGLSVSIQFIKMILQATTRKDCTKALHVTPLLRRLVPGLDQASIDGLIGPVLQCSGLGNTHLTVSLFGFLEELCRTKDDEDDLKELLARLVQLNLSQTKKIIEGLLRLKPSSMELEDIAVAWISAFGQAIVHPSIVGRLDVTPFIPSLLEGLNSTHEKVHLSCQLACSHLVGQDQIMAPLLLERLSVAQVEMTPYLLAIIRDQVMLSSGSNPSIQPYTEIIQLIAALYDRKGFVSVRSDVTKAIGDFIKVFGSAAVLQIIPLGLDSTSQNRAWLLPVIKDAVNNDYLTFFITELLPLADSLQAKADSFRGQQKLADAKVYETVVYQIWSCSPSYMKYSVDFTTAFPQFAPRMAEKMTNDPLIRPLLVNSLTQTINRLRTLEDDIGAGCLTLLRKVGDPEQDRSVIAGLAGNLLPVLFNLLGVTASEQRATLLDCIKAVMEVCPDTMVKEYFERVSSLLSTKSNGDEAATLVELLITMVGFLEFDSYNQLLNISLPILETATDVGLQKAGYKALHWILSHELYGPQLLESNWDGLEAILLHTAGSLVEVGAVKKCRFRLLLGIIPQLPDNNLHWIAILLPETVLGIKEANQKARLLSFELLLAMARRMARGGIVRGEPIGLPSDQTGSLDEFITMVLAGLAGRTPHMISATVVALARLLFDLSGAIPPETVQALLSDILLLLGSPSRELVKAAFGFIKVAIIVLPSEALLPHLTTLIRSVLAWSDEHALHFKVRVRHLMERLIRRFGYEKIHDCVPEEHRKLIVNIRKRKERARRRKSTTNSTEDDNNEMMDDIEQLAETAYSHGGKTSMMTRKGVSTSSQATRPSAKFEAALNESDSEIDYNSEEDQEEDIDMMKDQYNNDNNDDDLETALSRKLTLRTLASKKKSLIATKQQKMSSSKGKRFEDDFKTNPEGKLIIEDSDEDAQDYGGDDDDGIVVDEDAHRLYEQSMKTFSRPGKHVKFSQKRSRHDDDEDGEGDDDNRGVDYNGTIGAKSRFSRLSKVTTAVVKPVKHSGVEFKSKRSKGDVKKKGTKVEPYAYVPMQRAATSKSKSRYFLK